MLHSDKFDMEGLIHVAVFMLTGVFCQWWARRSPMLEYDNPPIRLGDWRVVGLAFLFLGIYEALLEEPLHGIFTPLALPSHWPLAVRFAGYLLLGDFISYWVHRLMHSRRFWPAHAFHHSAQPMNWVIALRGSFVHYAFSLLPYTFVGALAALGNDLPMVGALALIDGMNINLTHSNVAVPYPHLIGRVFVIPAMHYVHHHPNPRYTDSNFGFIFSFWDRAFGTFTDPATLPAAERGRVGLDYEIDKWSLILGWEFTARRYPANVTPALRKSA